MKRSIFIVFSLSLCFSQFAFAKERIVVLPITGSAVEASTLETVHLLLVSEIERFKTSEMVPESEILPLLGDQDCSEPVCAAGIGRQVNAAKVVLGRLNKLGDKIIFHYSVVEASSGATLLSDDLSALRVEDLDQVTKRIAASIVRQVPAEQTVEVGLVTEQESHETRTRKANSSWGIGFGYLYPQKGHDDQRSVFVWDFRSLYETQHLTVDALLGIRDGFTLNVGLLYLVGRTDFSPFVGAGVGFHAVAHEETYDYTNDRPVDKRKDGLELLVKAGFLAFRTYDFRVIANVEYGFVNNDYDDSAIYVTIGVMRAGTRIFGIF